MLNAFSRLKVYYTRSKRNELKLAENKHVENERKVSSTPSFRRVGDGHCVRRRGILIQGSRATDRG